ncbi:MAG: Rieske (2Fe-2S) protein [Bacteroidia bacterium]|jgi:Rieske Fe-S protein|nr:Rieske (2Fe-2S) protein [Bacteroidia bacterium]
MDRKNFLQTCGMACIGGSAMALLLQSCGISKTLTGTISDSDLLVSLSDFETKAGTETHYKKYVIVNNDTLKFPICVYRQDAESYTALWMQCTHQGAELQVFGDKLQCPAHGSEFDNKGKVTNSPASQNLRSFPITIVNNQLKISLKAV